MSKTFEGQASRYWRIPDTRYVPVRENGKWKYALPFKTVKDEMAAQVHHTGKDHWVTSIKMRNRNISVYDSCTGKMPSITDSMKIQLSKIYAAQLRQPIENSLDLCNLKTLRLYTAPFNFELDHYLTNVARVKSTYWG